MLICQKVDYIPAQMQLSESFALTVRQFPDKYDNNVCVHNAY